jgi:hypothetical protein
MTVRNAEGPIKRFSFNVLFMWARALRRVGLAALFASVVAFPASAMAATQVVFSTGDVDGKMAMASRPAGNALLETEAADDFPLTDATNITSASFTGLLPSSASLSTVQQVVVEIYRVFPNDSDVTRTSGPPMFSTSQVPTRVNSPSDDAFAEADSTSGTLSFSPAVLAATLSVSNSVDMGIHPKPTQLTGGEGPVVGEEVGFNVNFDPPISLPAGQYFFVPQVLLSSGHFLWLSAPKPIAPPGTPFPMGFTDLQAWIRNSGLEPDWLRVGTDIVGAGTFNGAFSFAGVTGCPAISISPASLPNATVGLPYATSFGGAGGEAPYTLSENGQLPSGMSFAAGALSGTPTQAGSFTFTVRATDVQDCSGSANVALTVLPAGGGSVRPAISSARLSSKTFRAAAHGASLSRRPPVGTKVSYRDSEAATTTFTVARAVKGHKRGRRCVARGPRKHQKGCTRYVKVGSFTHADAAGPVNVHFSGRVRGRKLKPGRYRLTLTPKLSGSSGKSVRLAFRIVR